MQQSIPGKPIAYISDNGRIHRIEEHPKGTAELAASFAAEFGCGEWARLAGLWHIDRFRFIGDLGKFRPMK